jgi:hypothetical protein
LVRKVKDRDSESIYTFFYTTKLFPQVYLFFFFCSAASYPYQLYNCFSLCRSCCFLYPFPPLQSQLLSNLIHRRWTGWNGIEGGQGGSGVKLIHTKCVTPFLLSLSQLVQLVHLVPLLYPRRGYQNRWIAGKLGTQSGTAVLYQPKVGKKLD